MKTQDIMKITCKMHAHCYDNNAQITSIFFKWNVNFETFEYFTRDRKANKQTHTYTYLRHLKYFKAYKIVLYSI